MRGDLYNGLLTLAGDFPPSLNTSDDVTALKPFESPACYGVDCDRDGLLKTGTIPTGTVRLAPTKTVKGKTYNWYYDRLWRTDTSVQTDIIFGAKYYDTVYQVQGRGRLTAAANVIAFQPAFKRDMWVLTQTGSQIVRNAIDDNGQFIADHVMQELRVSSGKDSCAVVLDEKPYCANTLGVWSYDGSVVAELTRPVRESVGAFGSEVQLTCDYRRKFIIGQNKFVIDTTNNKLYDYSTAGFLFTSRTLVADGYRPFGIGDVSFSLQFDPNDATDATISWWTKAEDNDWYQENDISVTNADGTKTYVSVRPENPCTTARKFAIKLTGLSSNLYIRQIDLNVSEYDQGTFSQ